MKTKYPLIHLASQSSRRRSILKRLGVPFKVVSSGYREKPIRRIRPRQLVLVHAEGKVRCAKWPKTARYVLGADTIVVLNGKILGKPADPEQAFRMLRSIQGRSHWVYTGLVLWNREKGRFKKGCVTTRVWVKKMSPENIRRYMQKVHPLDKAGSYGIQEGPAIVQKIRGSYSNVVGLPVELLKEWLRREVKKNLADNHKRERKIISQK